MSYDSQIEKDNRLADTIEPVIELERINKAFSAARMSLLDVFSNTSANDFQALTDISLTIYRGETVGVLGANGAGKSTLMQLIVGTLKQTSGMLRVRGKVSALLELGAGFNPDWTGRRNSEFYCMIQGATQDDLPELLRNIEEFADIGTFFEQPVRTYSSGMFLRVAFASAIVSDPDIVIVDEALAVGDSRFQNKCFNKFKQLKEAGKTIILVTHAPEIVTQFCTRGMVLEGGRLIADGSPDDAVTAYRQILYGGEQERTPSAVRFQSKSTKPVAKLEDVDANTQETLREAFVWPPDCALLRTRRHYNQHENVAGSGIGQIADIQLLDQRFKPCGPVVSTQTRLKIAVQFASMRNVIEPRFGIVIKSKENVVLFGVSNDMLKQPNYSIQAGEAFVVCFDVDISLARGDYFIDVGLAEADGSELDVIEWRMSVCHFTVENSREMYGFADMEAVFVRC